MRTFTFFWFCGPDCDSRSVGQSPVVQSIVRIARSIIKDAFSPCIKIRGSHIHLLLLYFVLPKNIKELLHCVIFLLQGCHGQGKNLEKEIFSRSGKSQEILLMAREN